VSPITASYYVSAAVETWLLAIAIAFLYFRLDDLIYDVICVCAWIRRRSGVRSERPALADLYATRQKRMAIFVPCWHEAEVIERMIDCALNYVDYDNFDIFVGVYPNDAQTVGRAVEASKKSARIHVVVNERDGPTTKAQNLNSMYRAMEKIEGDDPFELVVLHDVEDVIHPLEFRLQNHLVPSKQMVQTPVFPLERPWYDFLGWTYADEFARCHLKDMVGREFIGAFIPSAGVGTAFSREALRTIAEDGRDLFPERSLTEDYLFALRLQRRGLRATFINTRLSPERKRRPATAAAYVSTREYFPNRLTAIVRQKSRWVAGICLQSWSEIGWRGSLADRYALYRDRKGLVSNLLCLFGWIAIGMLGCMYAWKAFDGRVFAPEMGTNATTALILNLVLLGTLFELVQTACFTAWVYGPTQGLLSIVRAPFVALINGLATIRALYTFMRSRFTNRAMAWSKTQHVFPGAVPFAALQRQFGVLHVEQSTGDPEMVPTASA
jgi:bacteriophage N4 adsorption protein B